MERFEDEIKESKDDMMKRIKKQKFEIAGVFVFVFVFVKPTSNLRMQPDYLNVFAK